MKRKRRRRRSTGTVCISIVVVVFVAVMAIQIYQMKQKDADYMARENELKEQYEQETQRSCTDSEDHVPTDNSIIYLTYLKKKPTPRHQPV